ncbi:MAG: transcription termination/antitermination protein NusG [Clostridiales bacterium]|jgi:transcriptional antiterminator NusG|nr:transcription termination/antitermination protein NusG [Clostridiales bacterium]
MLEEYKWYVIHTFSGYENKVKTDIEKVMENYESKSFVEEIKIPTEEIIEVKDGKRKSKIKKIFPGYVFIKMNMNDDTWCIVRNCRGVTGFVGPGPRPLPLSEKEILKIGFDKKTHAFKFDIGDSVIVKEGVLEGFVGVIQSIDVTKGRLKAKVSMFDRDTEVELKFDQVGSLVE